MKYTKLNPNWNADRNAPQPELSTINEGIALSFQLNANDFEYIDEGEMGKLEFYNVYAYRLATIGHVEYLKGQSRFKNNQLPWGDFYEIKEGKWPKDLPDDRVVLDESIDKNDLRHFIFFLKDHMFECLAIDFKFIIDNNLESELEEKYPKGYLNYYLSMFASQFEKPSVDNFKVYTNLYLQIESKKEFTALKEELVKIKKNNDLKLYLKYANGLGMADFGIKQLNDLVKVIETYKV